MSIQINYWRAPNDVGEYFDSKLELDEICETYPACEAQFRDFVRQLAREAVSGDLSRRTFNLPRFLYEALRAFAPPWLKPIIPPYPRRGPGGGLPPSAEIEIRVGAWNESWQRWRQAGVARKLSTLLAMLLTCRPLYEWYTAYNDFDCSGVGVRFWVSFDVERDRPDSTVSFWKFETFAR